MAHSTDYRKESGCTSSKILELQIVGKPLKEILYLPIEAQLEETNQSLSSRSGLRPQMQLCLCPAAGSLEGNGRAAEPKPAPHDALGLEMDLMRNRRVGADGEDEDTECRSRRASETTILYKQRMASIIVFMAGE
ncbi:hypothetical protein TgHK011_004391 [Trichoderma gracile]|nr:hypothetical protein TgHK011_004391 [Trichoderma gracile]